MNYLYAAAAIPFAVVVIWLVCNLVAAVADAIDRHAGKGGSDE